MFSIYNKLLEIIINEIIPKTKKSVAKGNKIFGGAILDKKKLSTIIIGTNNEIKNPLYHGEIVTLNNFYKHDKIIKKKPSDYIFLSTHEPCSLCLSALAWSGFKEIYYFFPYIETKNSFNIPHDLNILKEIFNIKKGQYNKKNSYWKIFSIIQEVNKLKLHEKKTLNLKVINIQDEYLILSKLYQKNKNINKIPLK